MRSVKKDVIKESRAIGVKTAEVAEAVENTIADYYSEIINKQRKVKASSIEEAFKKMEQNTADLYQKALSGLPGISKDISKQTKKIFNQSLKQAKRLVKIDSDDAIKKYLFRITGDQLDSNQKITYKGGRKMNYKSYVEMATRTRVQHQLLEQQQEFGNLTQQLFYLCDTYSDCANDHLDFQGKFYYSETVLRTISKENPHYKEIMRGVRRCEASVEAVTHDSPYLTTRPNCRHRLIPVAIEDVIKKPLNKVLKEQGADMGNFTQSQVNRNYQDSQKQRKIELSIRRAKRNINILEKNYNKTQDIEVLNKINRAKQQVGRGQANMRKLINSNKTLKRDYRRENPYYLRRDLGVAYNTKPIRARFDIEADLILDSQNLIATQGKQTSYLTTVKNTLKADIENNAGVVTYIKANYNDVASIYDNDDTTIIVNEPVESNVFIDNLKLKDSDDVLLQVIIPPKARDQIRQKDDKLFIGANAVYDVVGVRSKKIGDTVFNQIDLLMRSKL